MRWVVAVALGLVACTGPEPGTTDVEATGGSVDDFATYVQPVLRSGCASLDCHGNAGRPLRLYARYGLRVDVGLRGEDASEAEMTANMSAITGLDPTAPSVDEHVLLLKPLSTAAGGLHHVGGDLWPDRDDAVYHCLHAWLRAADLTVCPEVTP